MSKIVEGVAKFWQSFMLFNKQFDSTLFIILTFWTLWKMLDMLGSGEVTNVDAVKVITDYTSVFSHIFSAIVGALFMKAAMNESSKQQNQNGGQ